MIVDELDKPVSSGQQGELLVRTSTMMRGYFRRPDLDRKAFFYRQNSDCTSDTFYRTGDLVTQSDGELYFIGRADRQIKLRGYRVELDEVEAVFDKHADVEQSAAFISLDSDQRPTLEIAVCRRGGSRCSTGELRRFAARVLPAYALPEAIHFVTEFPRTSTGKINRNRLCQPLDNAPGINQWEFQTDDRPD
jgi:acyl-CoA synthetase (AMP-forming)/AMP-acid ligase II